MASKALNTANRRLSLELAGPESAAEAQQEDCISGHGVMTPLSGRETTFQTRTAEPIPLGRA